MTPQTPDDSVLQALDKELNPPLAATLAGISLTGAIFLIGFVVSIRATINTVSPFHSTIIFFSERARIGIHDLLYSFASFLSFLIQTLSMDVYIHSDAESVLLDMPPPAWLVADVGSGNFFTAIGLYYLGQGARNMYHIAFANLHTENEE
jgi:hypothetical protein